MSQQELLVAIVRFLNQAHIDYIVTGSVVSSLQGEPRSTHDIDFVVQISLEDLPALHDAFPEKRFYLDDAAVAEAIRTGSMFNMIDTETGDKADFWMITDDEFDHARFARRRDLPYGDIVLSVSTPEDTIIQKLRWALQSGGSTKQFTDALRVYEVQGVRLDKDYVKRWTDILGLSQEWTRLRKQAKQVD